MTSAAAIVLGVVFAWAGIGKAARAAQWRSSLRWYALPRAARASGFLILPWVELVAACLLLAGRPALGATIVVVLVAIFFFAIIRARLVLRTDQLGCACFGARSVHDYRVLLARNAALGALAGYLLGTRSFAESSGPGLPGAGRAMLLSLLVVVAAFAASWLAVQLLALRREASSLPIRKAGEPDPAS